MERSIAIGAWLLRTARLYCRAHTSSLWTVGRNSSVKDTEVGENTDREEMGSGDYIHMHVCFSEHKKGTYMYMYMYACFTK